MNKFGKEGMAMMRMKREEENKREGNWRRRSRRRNKK